METTNRKSTEPDGLFRYKFNDDTIWKYKDHEGKDYKNIFSWLLVPNNNIRAQFFSCNAKQRSTINIFTLLYCEGSSTHLMYKLTFTCHNETPLIIKDKKKEKDKIWLSHFSCELYIDQVYSKWFVGNKSTYHIILGLTDTGNDNTKLIWQSEMKITKSSRWNGVWGIIVDTQHPHSKWSSLQKDQHIRLSLWELSKH